MSNDEINKKIAEKVMGWTLATEEVYNTGRNFRPSPDHMPIRFEPCDRIAEAWQVVEKMRELGFGVCLSVQENRAYCAISKYSGALGQGEILSFEGDAEVDSDADAEGSASTAPMAICLAALKTLGEDV